MQEIYYTGAMENDTPRMPGDALRPDESLKPWARSIRIPINKEELRELLEWVMERAFRERCERFGCDYEGKISKIVALILDHYTDRFWPMDFPEQNTEHALAHFNIRGSWDDPGELYRTAAGVETMLMIIEPPEVFARLHAENLKYIDPELIERHGLQAYVEKIPVSEGDELLRRLRYDGPAINSD